MNRILEQVQSGDFDPKKMFAGNKDEFLEVKTAIESISNNLSKETYINFILTKIIPTIFDKSVDSTVRDKAVEIGLHFLKFVDVSILSTKEQEDVFNSIEETYTKVIGELRDSNYANWDKLWVFLVKLCSEKLHTKMSLANKLLRVVEVAFRNSISIEQRLKAYDCWIELINNSSLNMEHMCSARQIKLLVTPMKAKFSRMPVVIIKRCDTFVYLLEKLQENATLCLKEFLEFCFGPFNQNDIEKTRCGSIPDVCRKSTTVLLEIIGHSHDSSEVCLSVDDLHLYKPLINNDNFASFSDILISSVVQCCILLNEWSRDMPKNNSITKCLWRSLLQLVRFSSDEVQKKCCTQINNALRLLLERSQNSNHFYIILGNIVALLIQDLMVEKFKEIIFDIAMNILHDIDADNCPFNLKDVKDFVISCFDAENESKFDKIASSSFRNESKCKNSILCDIWLKSKITVVPDNVSNFIWPIRHLKNFRDVEATKSKWVDLYNVECRNENMKFIIMQEMEKLFLENPLLCSNIVEFLELISSGDTNSSKDFVAKLMKVIEVVLTLPNLTDSDVTKVKSIVLNFCNPIQHFYKSENKDEALDKLCICLELLVTVHKEYAILSELVTLLKRSSPKNLVIFSKRLMSFLEALMLNEDNSIANTTRKLIELLETKENESDTLSMTSARSLRLVNMANVTPKSNRFSDQANNLKLFGKDVAKTSPLSAKSSRLKNRFVDNKKKKDSVIVFEDKSSDYVKIDSEVKINHENLNEHQKEVFKRRREDIPALYQDLTQSQSQDFDKVEGNDSEDELKKVGEVETKKNFPVSSKKRGGDDDIENEHADKKNKITEENLKKETEKLPEPINGDNEDNENSQDITTEVEKKGESNDKEVQNISNDETPDFLEKNLSTENVQNLIEEDKVLQSNENESVKEKSSIQEEADVQKKEEASVQIVEEADAQKEEADAEKKEEEADAPRIETEKNLPKRSRHPSIRFRDELMNAVQKQLEQSADQNSESKNEREADTSKEQIENNLNKSEGSVRVTSLRKSTRQVKKRQSDYMVSVQKRQYIRKNLNKTDNAISQNSDISDKGKKETKSKNNNSTTQNNSFEKNKRKEGKQKHVNKRNVEEESIGDLLARVDMRIGENKKLERSEEGENAKTWEEDGNQNKIVFSTKKLDEDSKIDVKGKKIRKSKTPTKSESPENQINENISVKVVDEYQFKDDDDSQKKKIKKNKRKTMYFSRSDYVARRRKKVKKVNKEEGFPFHVTADSPVPLSKSPSLRAVPSQVNETLTILITRSPPESVRENKESPQGDSLTSPNKKSKRKTSPNSEDVIESSQPTETFKQYKNSSRTLRQVTIDEIVKPSDSPDSNKRKTRNSNQKDDTSADTETMTVELIPDATPEKKTEEEAPKFSKTRRLSLVEPENVNLQVGNRLQRSQSLDKLELASEKISLSSPEKEKQHVHDTSADTLTYQSTGTVKTEEADTFTLSPDKSQTKDDLPSSPVTYDTPDRTFEFLNNTSDISPISSVPEDFPTPKQAGGEVSRVARLLHMANSNALFANEGGKWFGSKHSSPSTSRVRKMRLKREENFDILTFSREVPSPLTVPASGILKRKLGSLEETAAPSPKRKRVNFSDPAITAKKIFIKEADEYVDSIESPSSVDDQNDCNDKTPKVFLDGEDHIESSIKDAVHSGIFNDPLMLKQLLQNLKVPEVVEVISDYLANAGSETIDEIKCALSDAGSSQVVSQFVLPMAESVNFEEFLPILIEVVKKLSDEKREHFIDEITNFSEERKMRQLTEQQIEDHITDLDCDKMNDLIKKYISSLENQKRNDFAIKLLNLASSELPVNKEFVNCHVKVLQNFVEKMTD